jgi:RNA polymerase sigma-70 factor (ECF subfamily)
MDDGLLKRGGFATTRWSVIAAAGKGGEDAAARAALEELCAAYWPAVYSFVRRCGHDRDAALDLTQEFFTRLLERQDLRRADPARGRFRSFLLACVRHFLANEQDRAAAKKRGGGKRMLSIDETDAEGRYLHEPMEERSPEQAFDHAYALALLDRVLGAIAREHEARGKRSEFEALRPFLTKSEDAPRVAAAAKQAGLTEGAFKVALHRLRRGFGERLRREIAETVASAEEVDDEIKALFAAL